MDRIPRSFLAVDPETLARRLLGQRLVRTLDDGTRLAGIIVETEAYLGVRDRAAHSFGGRRTPRNESMYASAGTAYVYFTYGMHHCVNVVCGRRDEPVAVLIRALEPVEGLDVMRTNRAARRAHKQPLRETDLCSGPAKLAQALGITRELDGVDLTRAGPLHLERARTRPLPRAAVVNTPRIGVGYAGRWAARRLRWRLAANPHVSRP
ncbi:MAG: DNA-3-methyladenine glycosylase [Planctomycetes bacterium]|nr:DNA-3-methyladenine glycosylase [Planctomycetota bacterium]